MRNMLIAIALFSCASHAFACYDPALSEAENLQHCLTQAEQGNAQAQYIVGTMFEEMPAPAQSIQPSFNSTSSLNTLGNLGVQTNPGTTFDLCLDISDGPIEAIKWYRRAAAQGFTDAQIRLGKVYEFGHGVPHDDMLAYMWFDIAARQGREESRKYRATIAARINPELIPEAQGLAEEWLLEYRQ